MKLVYRRDGPRESLQAEGCDPVPRIWHAMQVLTRPSEGDPAISQLLQEAAASVPGRDDLAVLDDIESCLLVGSVQKVRVWSQVMGICVRDADERQRVQYPNVIKFRRRGMFHAPVGVCMVNFISHIGVCIVVPTRHTGAKTLFPTLGKPTRSVWEEGWYAKTKGDMMTQKMRHGKEICMHSPLA